MSVNGNGANGAHGEGKRIDVGAKIVDELQREVQLGSERQKSATQAIARLERERDEEKLNRSKAEVLVREYASALVNEVRRVTKLKELLRNREERLQELEHLQEELQAEAAIAQAIPVRFRQAIRFWGRLRRALAVLSGK